jgi:hypothetical protein
VIDLLADDSAPAVVATFNRDLGVISVLLRNVESVDPDATERDVAGELVDRAYVVRAGDPEDNEVMVQIHLGEAAEAAVFVLADPARVVVDVQPGGDELPPPATFADGVVILEPRAGGASYPLTVAGYARTFEANVVVRIAEDGTVVSEDPTPANDWTEMWGWFEETIPSGPFGTIELQVGEYSAADASWEGASLELEMQ